MLSSLSGGSVSTESFIYGDASSGMHELYRARLEMSFRLMGEALFGKIDE